MLNRSSRVPLLVLAHLGLLPFVACKEDSTHVAEPTASVTADPTATPTTSVSVAVSASATTSAAPAETATVSPSNPPGSCASNSDCPAYGYCAKAPGSPGALGHCEYQQHYNLGRPLVVDGVAYLAPYVNDVPQSRDAALRALRQSAREEHASIAAFARTIAELIALGAPTWLLHETQRALADEIRHTEMALAMVEHVSGESPVLGALPEATLPLRRGEDAAAALFRDVFRGGAVGETLAAADAEQLAHASEDVAIRVFYNKLVADESRHAALAFKTLRWLLDAHPELASVLAEERAQLLASGSARACKLVAPLLAAITVPHVTFSYAVT